MLCGPENVFLRELASQVTGGLAPSGFLLAPLTKNPGYASVYATNDRFK
jgi:hypothetical protein